MVAITNNSTRQNLYETIYDTLTSANLLSSTASVKAAYVDDETLFPLVVVNPVNIDMDSFTFDRSYKGKTLVINIDVWTKKNKDKDVICDEIDVALSSLKIPGVSLVDWSEANAFEPQGGNKVHLKTVSITYKR